jgi:hypothetical protein
LVITRSDPQITQIALIYIASYLTANDLRREAPFRYFNTEIRRKGAE